MGLFSTIGSVAGTYFGPLGTTLGGAVGSALDGGLAGREQERTNEWNAAEAQKNRDFQEKMRASQYQTTVKDLQAAGLNPMLAYTNGGAGNLSGSTPAPMQNKISTGMSSAQQSANTLQSLQGIEMAKAQIEQVNAQTDKIRAETTTQALATAEQAARIKNLASGADVNTYRADSESWHARALQEQFQADKDAGTFSARSLITPQELRKALASANTEEARAQITKYAISSAKEESSYAEKAGEAPFWLRLLMNALGAGNSAASLGRALK